MITTLYNYLHKYRGLTPEQARVIIAQGAHESNFFRSELFKKTNNIFGIKAHSRKIKGKNEAAYNGYATYQSVEASCDDLIDLVKVRYSLLAANNIYAYATILKERGYYEAPLREYISGMLNAYEKLFPMEYKQIYG